METDSVLYLLMGERMNGIINGIMEADGEYQEIKQKSDVYSDRLDGLHLPKEARLLIDRYVSKQNAHSTILCYGSRYGMLAYLLGFSDCRELFLGKAPFPDRAGAALKDVK